MLNSSLNCLLLAAGCEMARREHLGLDALRKATRLVDQSADGDHVVVAQRPNSAPEVVSSAVDNPHHCLPEGNDPQVEVLSVGPEGEAATVPLAVPSVVDRLLDRECPQVVVVAINNKVRVVQQFLAWRTSAVLVRGMTDGLSWRYVGAMAFAKRSMRYRQEEYARRIESLHRMERLNRDALLEIESDKFGKILGEKNRLAVNYVYTFYKGFGPGIAASSTSAPGQAESRTAGGGDQQQSGISVMDADILFAKYREQILVECKAEGRARLMIRSIYMSEMPVAKRRAARSGIEATGSTPTAAVGDGGSSGALLVDGMSQRMHELLQRKLSMASRLSDPRLTAASSGETVKRAADRTAPSTTELWLKGENMAAAHVASHTVECSPLVRPEDHLSTSTPSCSGPSTRQSAGPSAGVASGHAGNVARELASEERRCVREMEQVRREEQEERHRVIEVFMRAVRGGAGTRSTVIQQVRADAGL